MLNLRGIEGKTIYSFFTKKSMKKPQLKIHPDKMLKL